MSKKAFEIYITVIYKTCPDQYQMIMTPRPQALLERMRLVSDKKLALGVSYRFGLYSEAESILKQAHQGLIKRDGDHVNGWYFGSVSRAVRYIELAINAENKARREMMAQGYVIGSLKYQKFNPVLEAADAAR